MKKKRNTLLTIFLLLLVTAGQSVSLFSASCAMDTPAVQTGMDMAHAQHAMAEPSDQVSEACCCADSGNCLTAQCAAVAVLNTPDKIRGDSPIRFRLPVPFFSLPVTGSALFRPPIIA